MDSLSGPRDAGVGLTRWDMYSVVIFRARENVLELFGRTALARAGGSLADLMGLDTIAGMPVEATAH